MILELERFAYTPWGTFGRLKANGFECLTVEEIWANNQRSKSCIPIGIYQIVRGQFPKHGEAFEVINVPDRSAILIHVANTIDDIEGCIGPGEDLGWVYNKWAVVNSRATYKRFMRFMSGKKEAKLRIFNYQGGVVQ